MKRFQAPNLGLLILFALLAVACSNGGLSEAQEHYNTGIAHAEGGDFERAIQNYDEAIRSDPQLAVAYGSRGMAHSTLGRIDQGIHRFPRA